MEKRLNGGTLRKIGTADWMSLYRFYSMARLIKPSDSKSPSLNFASIRGAWKVQPKNTRFSPVFQSAPPSRDLLTASRHIRTPFQQQLGRETSKWWLLPANDNGFPVLSEPPISSKFKRVIAPNIRKSLPRKPPSMPLQVHYEPQFDSIWAKTPVTDFKRTAGRTQAKRPPALDYSVKFEMVSPRAQTARLLERPEAVLPTHMVKGTSRMALTVVQHGSLVMNAFPFN